jgi:exodeoxyribonuclease III
MRIATWNVNSLKARMDALEKWLERADPDILLMQETKLADADAPAMWFGAAGYELTHHGEGRWNGVAIASRKGLDIDDVVTNFGDGPVRDSSSGASGLDEEDFNPFDEARMLSAVVGGVRVVCLYAPNGRVVGSPFFEGKLRWFERLRRWLDETRSPDEPLILGGDYNVDPDRRRRLGPGQGPRRDARLRAGAGGARPAPRLGPRRRLPRRDPTPRPLHVVGLPRRHVPPQRGHADRPPVRSSRSRSGSSGPRSTARRARAADPVRPCPGRARPRRAGKPFDAAGTRPSRGSRPGRGRRATRARPRSATTRSARRRSARVDAPR